MGNTSVKQIICGIMFNHSFSLLDDWGKIADSLLYSTNKAPNFSPQYFKIECAVCENRLSAIEEDIGKLNTDQITREILNLQLDALRQELNSASALQTTELKNRIDLLERQIELLQE